MQEIIQKIITSGFSDIQEEVEYDIENLLECCESPIEKALGLRLMFYQHGWSGSKMFNKVWIDCPPNFNPDSDKSCFINNFDLVIIPQWELKNYRADFLILFKEGQSTHKFVIECDGHDFHEKTKEQAARDKARDRFFTSIGCQMFRYTGSEIYKNDDMLLMDFGRAIDRCVIGVSHA